jgi:hypothetical protein
MRACMLLVCATTWLYGIAVQPAGVAANALPLSDSRVHVDQPLAVYSPDGSVWLFWWQGVAFERSRMLFGSSPGLRRVGSELGVFYRLVGPDGTDLLGPKRAVVPETWNDAVFGLNPGLAHAIVGPDGRAVLFLLYAPDEPEWPGAPRRAVTQVVSIDRAGRVTRRTLDFPIRVSGSTDAGGKASGALYTCFDGRGVLHIFSVSRRDVHYVKLQLGGPSIKTLASRGYRHSERENPTPADSYLRWAWDAWERADITLAGPDTLLAAYTPDGWGKYDRWWNGDIPGDTLAVYRIRLKDLSLIDSLRLAAASVKGAHFENVRLPRAVLQRTRGGFTFYLPRPNGTDSYMLGLDGRPTMGPREERIVYTSQDFPWDGTQFLLYRRFPYLPWKLDWFGLGTSSQVYHDSLITEAVPGRVE